MKLTKTLAALGILGAALLAFASCKDTSGDGKTTNIIPGVAKKWALSMTVDATGDNIEVGKKAITDSNGDDTAVTEILADTEAGKTNPSGHEAERQRCGKRFFQEFTSGFNNNEGFRMNIVLSKDGTWTNAGVTTDDKPRTATAGVLFDFYEYEKQAGNKTYDFFFLAFKPTFTAGKITKIYAFFERYSGVKKYKEGIYTSHADASALGSNFIQTAVGTWDEHLYPASAGKTWSKELEKDKDYKLDADGNAIIGVDIKQLQNGLYTVSFGTIKYYVGSEEQEFSVTNFKQGWKTKFTPGQTIGKGGDPNGTSSISGYDNWTHISKTDKSTNLKGGVLTYAFAPYGTKPVVNYFICSTSKSSGSTDTQDSEVDYVGDWKVPATLDERPGVTDKIFYEEGNVVHEYIYY